MQVTIERAGARHIADISRIGKASFADAFEHLFESKTTLTTYLDHTYALRKLATSIANPNNILFVAFANKEAVGFAKMKKRSVNPHLQSSTQSELQKIYVLKTFHGTGVAAALMEAVTWETECLQANHLWLDVHISNSKARRFYEKHDFNRIGDHHFTIGNQQFEYDVMARSF